MRPSAASGHANPAPLPLSFFSSAVQRSQQPPHQYQPQPLNRLYAGHQASDPYEELIHESRARPFVPPTFHSQMQNHEYGYGQQQWQYNREADLTPGSVSRGNSGLSYAADRYDEYGYPPAYTRDSTGMTSLASGRYGEFGSGFGGGYEGNSSSYDQMPARRQPTNQQPGSQDPIASLLNARKRREEATSFFNPPIPRPLLPSLADANPPTMFGSKPNPFASPSASAYGQPPNHYAEDVLHGLPQSQPLYSRTTFATAQQAGLQPSMRLTSGGELLHDLRNGNRLKKLLGAPENKELWLETRTGSSVGGITQIDNPLEEDRLYYYNPVTLQVTFDKPSPMNSHLMPQSECQKLLDMMTPSTLIVKRIFRQLTAEKLRSHFEQYGPVAFTKVCRYKDLAKASSKAGASRNLVYFRMETVQAQNKILEKSFHLLEGHEVEVRIPANRIFIGRVPDRTSPIELVRFFSQEVAKMDPSAYCVDAYLPLPYRQFAFCTVGGPSMAPKLALKADFFFHGVSITVSTCHTESQVDAERLFERKVQNLVDHNELARVRALQSIAVEVKFLLQILGKMKKFNSQRMLLAEINNQFLKCTEEKLRNYLSIQEHVLDICQLVAMKGDDLDENNLFKRKRQRLANTAEEEGGENDGDEEEEEEENFDEDETAKKLVSQSSDQFVISSTSMAKNNQQPSSSEEATTHIVKILTKG